VGNEKEESLIMATVPV